jgi:hypothetical protein
MGVPLLVLILLGFLVMILIFILIGQFAINTFKKGYEQDVRSALEEVERSKELLVEDDIQHLPTLVQGYLRRTGAIGQPKVKHFKARFKAEMRGKNQDWFSLEAEQHNFIAERRRLFFLKAKVKGLPTVGYHAYTGKKASMRIKIFGILPIVNIPGGKKIYQAETVTFFNDMCILAPAALIDPAITWKAIDDRSVRATLNHNELSVSAILIFNEENRLINFVSDDRYEINAGKKFRFSTPLSEFKKINDLELPNYGEAIWHYPEGEFVYGKYNLQKLEYNGNRV